VLVSQQSEHWNDCKKPLFKLETNRACMRICHDEMKERDRSRVHGGAGLVEGYWLKNSCTSSAFTN
jgi:hypothetical protein